jgi:hypothetical protein
MDRVAGDRGRTISVEIRKDEQSRFDGSDHCFASFRRRELGDGDGCDGSS